jgi:AraC family ethanolamine operon transcriptional activator
MADGPRASPPVQSIVFDSFDPGTMSGALQRGELEHLQLAKGRFQGSIQRAQSSGARIDWGRYNLPLLASGGLAEDRVSLGFIISANGEGYISGQRVRASEVVVLPERGELYFRLAPATEWISFQVARSLLAQLGVELTPRDVGVIAISDAERAALRGAIAEIGQVIGPDRDPNHRVTPGELAWAQEELLAAFAHALATRPSITARGPRTSAADRLRLVHRVEDYFESHLGDPLRVDELCAAVGTPLHTLERAFHDVHGISPKKFLTLRRLACARKDLMRRGPQNDSVTGVAMKWGFFHLSRFAAEYKAVFQESPSETLVRNR